MEFVTVWYIIYNLHAIISLEETLCVLLIFIYIIRLGNKTRGEG